MIKHKAICNIILIQKYIIALYAIFTIPSTAASEENQPHAKKIWPPEIVFIKDMGTGLTLRALTSAPFNDVKIYQTHPQWTSDGKWIIFGSPNRAPDRTPQAFAVNEADGTIVQLTNGPGIQIGDLNISRTSNKLVYLRKIGSEIQLITSYLHAENTINTEPNTQSKLIKLTTPDGFDPSGGLSIDNNEEIAYLGFNRISEQSQTSNQFQNQKFGRIIAISLLSGQSKTVLDTPFRIGHVQANPWKPGEILYCNETGGDAPQRMWVTSSDGSANRPLYIEAKYDWVTHEVYVDRDHVGFVLMGNNSRLRRHPTGIYTINLRNNEVEAVGQTSGNGYWHTAFSPDGLWALGDTFDGSIDLINRQNGQRHRLTTGHPMRAGHVHASFSPDSRRVLLQSDIISRGKSLDLMEVAIPDSWRLTTPEKLNR